MDLQFGARPVEGLRRSTGRRSRGDAFAIGALGAELGEVPKRSNGADCKSAGYAFGGSNPPLSTRRACHGYRFASAGIAQLARARAFQARGRGFESRFPLQKETSVNETATKWGTSRAHVAQVAEHVLGKDGVTGSNPVVGSKDAE